MLDSIAPTPQYCVSRVVAAVVVLLLVSCLWSTPLVKVIVVNISVTVVTLACLSLELISSCVFDCVHARAHVCSW